MNRNKPGQGARPIASTRVPWEVHHRAVDAALVRGITRAELYRQIIMGALAPKEGAPSIKNEQEYERSLREIDRLARMNREKPKAAHEDRIEVLATLVEAYETQLERCDLLASKEDA